jgi:hypothetical protein
MYQGPEKAELVKWLDALEHTMTAVLSEERMSLSGALNKTLRLARQCRHPDAVWLTSLFPEDGVRVTRDDFMQELSTQEDDPRAVFFRCALCMGHDPGRQGGLRRAAKAAYAPALRFRAELLRRKAEREGREEGERKMLRRKAARAMGHAARAGDRDAMFVHAAAWLKMGPANLKAVAQLHEAANLGQLDAMLVVAGVDPKLHMQERVSIFKRALSCDFPKVSRKIGERFERKPTLVLAFALGGACHGMLESEQANFFGEPIFPPSLRDAEKVFLSACEKAAAAVECWIGVARRLGVVRDLRRVIAKLLWRDRHTWAVLAPSLVTAAEAAEAEAAEEEAAEGQKVKD